jgi:hypothetical protein
MDIDTKAIREAMENGVADVLGYDLDDAALWLCDALDTARAEIERMREALQEISKKEGRFSMDPLEHASNCVEDMAQIAQEALKEDK